MKLEVIGERTLLIQLAISDLEENGFKQDDFKAYNPEIRKFVYSVINNQSLLNFNNTNPIDVGIAILDDTIMIQVTKIENEIEDGNEDEVADPHYIRPHLGYEMVCFETFADLLTATSQVILKYKRISKSKLFTYEQKYYLSINTLAITNRTQNRIENIFSILTEFGDYDDFTEVFLGEHGKLLIDKGAISLIGKLA